MMMQHDPKAAGVPLYERTVFRKKTHDFALVIPVINEGSRILSQLERIKELSPRVDVVLADGGSTDGSMQPAILDKLEVRALLVKTDSGKLSAQLRMGYAWCLDEDYRGIITVDGNGKDNVQAISRFVEKLQEGFDLIQGSRYLPGGEALNTPLDRRLAGSLIHAPLISIGGGFRYTDTTNGFRGYSAQLLRDPRVSPFRPIFDRYNLLFYLSVRAPRLGFKVTEIPVERIYPAKGSTPTKISGMKGRLAMLIELLKTGIGVFNP